MDAPRPPPPPRRLRYATYTPQDELPVQWVCITGPHPVKPRLEHHDRDAVTMRARISRSQRCYSDYPLFIFVVATRLIARLQ